jgi:hypothetical protein
LITFFFILKNIFMFKLHFDKILVNLPLFFILNHTQFYSKDEWLYIWFDIINIILKKWFYFRCQERRKYYRGNRKKRLLLLHLFLYTLCTALHGFQEVLNSSTPVALIATRVLLPNNKTALYFFNDVAVLKGIFIILLLELLNIFIKQ